MYPRNMRNSQVFFSANIRSRDIVETLRSNDPVKICAEKLRKECTEFDFLLDSSFCHAEDVKNSFENYKNSHFESWEKFFNTFCPFRTRSLNIQRKTDSIFQIIFNLIHNGRRKTPMHVALAEAIHETCKSKKLIRIMNHLGLCTSYDEVERIDTTLVQRTADMAGFHRVPVPPSIVSDNIVQGAMDSFDHNEKTDSGIGGSHYTILMLFQNIKDTESNQLCISEKTVSDEVKGKRALDHLTYISGAGTTHQVYFQG